MRAVTWSTQVVVAVLVAGLTRPSLAAPLPPPPPMEAPVGPRMAVVVVGLGEAGRAAEAELERQADISVSRVGRFELLGPDALEPTATAARKAAATEAAQRVKAAQQAIDDLDNTKATADTVEALTQLKKTNLSTGFAAYAQALLLKAASHATGGETAPAKRELERLMAIAPRTEVPSQYFPPDLIKFAEAQRRAASSAKGEIVVRTEPPGARVWVNGLFRGTSPLSVKGLTSGLRHVVTIQAEGYALVQDEVSTGESVFTLQPAELARSVEALRNAVTATPLSPARDEAATTFARQVGAEQVLLVLAKASATTGLLDLTALRIEVRDGHNAGYRTATLDVTDTDALEALFDALQRSDQPRVGGKPVGHFPVAPRAGPSGGSDTTLLGALVLGGAAVLGGIGAVSGVQAQSAYTAYRQTPQVQTGISQSFASQGRTFSVVADVTIGLAIGAVVTGVVLLATSHPEAPKASKDTPLPPTTPEPATRDAEAERSNAARQEQEARARREADAERQRADDAQRQEAKTKREAAEAEKQRADDAQRQDAKSKQEAEKQRAEEAQRAKREAEEAQRQDAKAKRDADAAKQRDEKAAAESRKEDDARQKREAEAEAEKQRLSEDARRRREAEAAEAARREDDAKAKKKKADEAPKLAPPPPPPDVKSSEDHDDLRNY